jgi:RNA polymerase sigma factor (TIGR02999 family)
VGDITLILERARNGDEAAAAELVPLVYQELRQLAAARMAREPAGQTLQATALVHEAWLRLGGEEQPAWRNRRHFFGAAAEAMRRILVERARRRQAARRGGGAEHVAADAIELPDAVPDERVLALHESLARLEAADPAKAELVKLRYFTGLSIEEAAVALDISVPTANRWWAFARAWLFDALRPD